MSSNEDWDKAVEDMKRHDDAQLQKPKRRGCGCRAWLFVIGIVVTLVWCFFVSGFAIGILEGTWFVPGDADNFDPYVALEEVQAFAGDNVRFLEMDINYVRPDGTLDLNASYRPSVDYVFVRRSDEQGENVPIGAPGYQASDIRYEYVVVEVNRPYRPIAVTSGSSSSSYVDLGMSRSVRSTTSDIPEYVPPPICPISQLWQIARSYDAPSNAVAVIKYTVEGYRFEIRDVNIRLQFNADCIVIDS